MQKCIEHLRITPAENGGHTVKHEYKRQPAKTGGGMSGSIGYDYPRSEEHVFGKDEAPKMMAHVSKALGLKEAQKEESEEV